jgi:predicted HTH transcriptional regulator
MTFVKRENWTEEQVTELPTGEHDYFERKSGKLFDVSDRNGLLDTLAKGASAFANSGGGHFILGVTDAGELNGVPHIWSGRTSTRIGLSRKYLTYLTIV